VLNVSAKRLNNTHAFYYEIEKEIYFTKKLKQSCDLIRNWNTDLRYYEIETEIDVATKLKERFTLLSNWNRSTLRRNWKKRFTVLRNWNRDLRY